MKVKKGTKLTVLHARKGTFKGIAAEDFDTKGDPDDFLPIAVDQDVLLGAVNYWPEGNVPPLKRSLTKVRVRKDDSNTETMGMTQEQIAELDRRTGHTTRTLKDGTVISIPCPLFNVTGMRTDLATHDAQLHEDLRYRDACITQLTSLHTKNCKSCREGDTYVGPKGHVKVDRL